MFYFTINLFYFQDYEMKFRSSEVTKIQKDALKDALFFRIPRNLVPELEEPINELCTLFTPIEDLNFYGADSFSRRSDDRTLQYISNVSFNPGWAKELYYYEKEFRRYINRKNLNAERRARTIRSNFIGPRGEKDERLIKTLFGTQKVIKKNWLQNGGTLVHRYIKLLGIRYALSHKKFIKDIKGLFYYPPGGFREWHTNMLDDTSWRMYYINATKDGKSWFRYVPPGTNETKLVPDKSGYYNMFRLRNKKDELLWHSVYSDTHRFSVGFKIHPSFAFTIIKRYEFQIAKGKEEL